MRHAGPLRIGAFSPVPGSLERNEGLPRGGRLPNWFERGAAAFLIAVIAILFALIFLAVLQALGVVCLAIISRLSGLFGVKETLQLLGIGIAGAVLLLQALIANRRAKAMEAAAAAQAAASKAHAEANLSSVKGQRQERMKNAIDHLGSRSESVRLGGAYELFHLAAETESLRQTVLDILCAHIRRTTREDGYGEEYGWKPSEEIASLLAQLFVSGHEVFSGCRINLRESRLNGADLRRARLSGANLEGARLVRALLEGARLERAMLSKAHLHGGKLANACLREASMNGVHLEGAWLDSVELQGANIQNGHLADATLAGGSLQGADLSRAELYRANLARANLAGTRLDWVGFQAALLTGADLRGAGNRDWDCPPPFADRIRGSIGVESSLSNVRTGGLEEERANQVAEELDTAVPDGGLPLWLRQLIGKPGRRGLPEGHGALLGSYGEEEAAGWIAEHDSVMWAVAGVAP